MIYAYPILQPQGTRADQILLTAAARSVARNPRAAVSNVNPIYAQIRDAAWTQAQATGNRRPTRASLANLDRARVDPGRRAASSSSIPPPSG